MTATIRDLTSGDTHHLPGSTPCLPADAAGWGGVELKPEHPDALAVRG